MVRRSLARLLAGAVSALCAVVSVFGQSAYPTRPVRLVVPYSAGSATDVLARTIGQKLSESWGQPVVVDAHPGAGGIIGTEAAARAAPDGYTLVMATNATHGINVSLYKQLPYDPIKDFAPIGLVASLPYLLLAHPSFPADSYAELVSLAKSQPGKLDLAGGVSTANLALGLLNARAGVQINYITYKSTPPALTDVLGGHVKLLIADPAVALGHIKAGRLKPLAVTTLERLSLLPEVPTLSELGLPGYEVVAWWGVMAPAGTPREILEKVNLDVTKVLKLADVREKLLAMGIFPGSSSPSELAAYVRSEIPKWASAVQAAGLQPQ
jgi:tripartite-type tricarboxylate transporter receptor subunit TctC